jgi:cobalt-zinc-cadmium efflux system outer membrane protein
MSATSGRWLGLACTVLVSGLATAAGQAPLAPAPQGNAGQSAAQSAGQTTAQAYAASAKQAVDPRKPAPSSATAMTLKQVLDIAEAKNPTLLAARRNLDATRSQELQARVRANPYFGVNGTNLTLPIDGSHGNPPEYAFQLSRLFERGDKRHWRMDFARTTTQQTQALLQDLTRMTLYSVKQAFFQMLIAKQLLELDSATLKDFQHEVEIAYDRYKAGDLGKLDYERLDLQLGNFESSESSDIVALRQASTQLQTLMGLDLPKSDFDIANDIVPPVIGATEDSLVQAALLSRPDYNAARAGVQVAEASYRLAIANGSTDPTVEVEFDKSGYYNSGGFNINIPVRIFDKNQGNKATARYQADGARFTETAVRNQVVSDVTQAWVGYSQAKRLSDRYTQHYLDESQDVLNIAQFAFEHGGLALIDYLDALRDARSATSDALNAYLQTWLAVEQLSSSSATELVP